MLNLKIDNLAKTIISFATTIALVFGIVVGYPHTASADPGDQMLSRAGAGFTQGSLDLLEVPLGVLFEGKVSAADRTYIGYFTGGDGVHRLGVIDDTGQLAGWSVTAGLSNFYHEDDGSTLDGAQLIIPAAPYVSSTQEDPGDPPASNYLQLEVGGAAQTAFSAAPGTGDLDWYAWYTMSSMGEVKPELFVRANTAKEGNYEAVITWTINDIP